MVRFAGILTVAVTRDEALGLISNEVASYTTLAGNESAIRELGDDVLKKLTIEVTLKLRQSTIVDLQV
ncbi:DUF3387 domain-containing protein [Klebsiella pneumoniae]|nr:DUF3387 domain-containing protein [Klebsiella pneumoniae]HBY0304737.1 DUF3387 domain-containing protein [Klebsiella pneumoniae subsp. pneumoniae]EJD6390153.1 DUF3387 domain-containing protein [Klebsiella pneumoniae]EKJ7645688.1 DUF3387 domain-containing protein [Klebsiella pneumoniae]EKU0011275.1 DUF3387 domain-containing protein [Klebsiella pneumoniae]